MTTDTAWADRYASSMDRATNEYTDITDAFKAAGFDDAVLFNSGGGCLLINVNLGEGFYALIGSAEEGNLPFPRMGAGVTWEMGLYSTDDRHSSGCEGYMVGAPYGITDPVAFVDHVAPLLRRIKGVTA